MTTHIDAVDPERNLCLSTTNGRTRNARRWFVYIWNPDTCKREWDYGRVVFRAWTFEEAMLRLSEPRIAKRIEQLIAKNR